MSASPDSLPIRHFSTDGIAPGERHEAWRMQGWPSTAQLCEWHAEPGFEARSRTVGVAQTTVMLGYYGAQLLDRTPELVRRAPVDHLHVIIPLDADIHTEGGTAAPGGTILCDLSQQWAHRAETGKMVTVAIPRGIAREYGIDPRAFHGTVIAPAATALLRDHLLRVVGDADTLPGAAATPLQNTILDLLVVTLAAHGRPIAPGERASDMTLRQRAQRLILAMLGDACLNSDYLGRTLRVSRANLYRCFAGEGGVQRCIRLERLHVSQVMLADEAITIGEIAARLHFTDPAHFSRAFRAEFGVSPKDWRAGARE